MAAPIHRSDPTAAAPSASPEKPRQARPFTMVEREAPPQAAAPAPAGPLSAPAAGPSPVERGAARLVGRLLADERRVDQGLAAAMSGKSFTPQELLVLQAQVIQYSQALEVVSRVVDKGTAAVKQVLGTQV